MNNLLVTIVALYAICVGSEGASTPQNPIDMARDACKAKTNVDLSILGKARSGDLTMQDPALKEYTNCVYFTLGVIDDQANLKIDELAKFAVDEKEKATLMKAIETCKDTKGTDANDKTWNMLKCFREQYPNSELDI